MHFDWDRPITYTLHLPAGSTRLEAATWTGFPTRTRRRTGLGLRRTTLHVGRHRAVHDQQHRVLRPPGRPDTTRPTGTISVNGGAATQRPSLDAHALRDGHGRLRPVADAVLQRQLDVERMGALRDRERAGRSRRRRRQDRLRAVTGTAPATSARAYSDGITLDATAPDRHDVGEQRCRLHGHDGRHGQLDRERRRLRHLADARSIPARALTGRGSPTPRARRSRCPAGSGTKTVRVQYRDAAGTSRRSATRSFSTSRAYRHDVGEQRCRLHELDGGDRQLQRRRRALGDLADVRRPGHRHLRVWITYAATYADHAAGGTARRRYASSTGTWWATSRR